MSNKREGFEPIIFCICGPSGSGKSTVCREILKRVVGLQLSISSTTRKPREGEIDGKDYRFLGLEQFQKKVKDGKFLEHAEYAGNCYGSEERNISEARDSHNDLILEIEVQGVKQVKEKLGHAVVVIFVSPPSMEILEERLRARGTESEEQIAKRLSVAKEELEVLCSERFSDYLVVNDQLDTALKNTAVVIEAERLRYSRFQMQF